MPTALMTAYCHALETLKNNGQYRQLSTMLPLSEPPECGRFIMYNGQRLLNLSSNDYLGIGGDTSADGLQARFIDYVHGLPRRPALGSTSSRLLTGNTAELERLEQKLLAWYQQAGGADLSEKAVLVVNSGYHANIGLLPALTALPRNTLILADKRVHASIIDGIRLSVSQHAHCQYHRYQHNDGQHLRRLLARVGEQVERIIIVTESIFSMDGDRADLLDLLALKRADSRIELYVDEAHAVGVVGRCGCGVAEVTQTLGEIDYVVGTFGKAFASLGAYVVCASLIKDWLVNHMRPLIFSTALPPFVHAWTTFVLEHMLEYQDKREQVAQRARQLSDAISQKMGQTSLSQSPIVPYVLGDNERTLQAAQRLQAAGFYVLPIRPPTVAHGMSRLRLVVNATLTEQEVECLISYL